MADENVPAPAPTRSNDQILPFAAWVLIRKREALEITPIYQAHQFESPPLDNAIMDFVNELGYLEELHFVSRMVVNNLYQPWRVILSMINQCLTGKTSRYDRPRYPVLSMLWGIITRTNVDYAKLMWEEFIQVIQTLLADKTNLGIATKKDKKIKPHVIPYCWFTKLIICYLGRKHNINQRAGSPLNIAEDDHCLGNLKFVPKGEEDEVFGMKIPKEMITDNIRNAPYYNAYLAMVAKHDQKSTVVKKAAKGKVRKVRKGKRSLQLVDEPDEEPQPAPKPHVEDEEYDLQRGIQMILKSFQALGQAPIGGVAFREPASGITQKLPIVEGKMKGIATDEHYSVSTYAETGAATVKTNSEGDTEILNIGEEQGENVATKVDLKEKTDEFDEGHARSDPGKTPESRPPPKRVLIEEDQAGPNPGQIHVALARPDPEPMHDDFVATMYPQVHESLKQPDKEHVHVENPLSSTRTLSSIKNLDVYTFGDKFFNDKPTEEDLVKTNMETEVESMVSIPIHQASSSVPPLSSPVIDLTLPKPVSSTVQEPIFTATTKITTTLPPPPLQQQSITDSVLASYVLVLETVALQAPHRDRFRDLSETDIKEILCDRIFENGSYRSQPKHVALYESLEASMDRDNRDEFLEATESRKRFRDDQDPPWKTNNTRDVPSSSSKKMIASQYQSHTRLVEAYSRGRKTNAFATSYKDPEENKLLQQTVDIGSFIKWFCRQIRKSKLSKVDLKRSRLQGGPPGQVIIQPQSFFNKDLEYRVLGNKERRSALSISKLKAANYPDFGLEELVPSLWIESKREYDISAAHGISHWWFKRKEFYITRHSDPSDHHIIKPHIWILSVVSLKIISRYIYTYLKDIVLRRADYNEYKISEFDFKNLHPNDLEDLYIVIRKWVEDLQLGIKSYQMKLNLTEPNWDASDFLFKEDYTIISKPRAIIYRGIKTRIWFEDDRRRSKELMEVIERRLKIRRIFRSLESFVNGRLSDVDYRLIQRTE
nr:monodehydroascorbate reductase [Tanacetum cinerariifolium]